MIVFQTVTVGVTIKMSTTSFKPKKIRLIPSSGSKTGAGSATVGAFDAKTGEEASKIAMIEARTNV
jgi:hypothetical protein